MSHKGIGGMPISCSTAGRTERAVELVVFMTPVFSGRGGDGKNLGGGTTFFPVAARNYFKQMLVGYTRLLGRPYVACWVYVVQAWIRA